MVTPERAEELIGQPVRFMFEDGKRFYLVIAKEVFGNQMLGELRNKEGKLLAELSTGLDMVEEL